MKNISINNEVYSIRHATVDDADQLLAYINTLSREQTFVSFQGEQQTLDQEVAFIKLMAEKCRNQTGLLLVVETNQQLVGVATIDLKVRSERHVGMVGISLAADYRDKGLGTQLLSTLLEEADVNLPVLRIAVLDVFANNPRAIHVYEKLGFVKFGLLPQGTHYRNEYVDVIEMFKTIRV